MTPVRRAPRTLVVCRAVFANTLAVGAIAALALYTAGALTDNAQATAFTVEGAVGMGLWWGVPIGFVHGFAQLVARHDRPENPADSARAAATAVSLFPVAGLIVASAIDVHLLWLAGLAALHGMVARRLAPRWVIWHG